MSATLLSTLTPNFPVYAERWPGGPLYFANGVDPVYKWNGYRLDAVSVGVETPGAGTPTIAGSGSGSITGNYQIYERFIDEDGNASLLSTASAPTAVSGVATLTFAVCPAPVGTRVVKRQILRNTDGEFTVFYVDVETTDLVSTSFTSTNIDDVLATQTPVPLFDSDGNSLTSIWTAPRADKPILFSHKGKMFACGVTDYTLGSISVTNGSTSVQGIGTSWSASMAGRELWVTGETTTYTIASLNTTTQVLTLSVAYAGTTNLFGVYAIRPAPAQRNTVFDSQSGEPEQWLPSAGFTVREIKDTITAGIGAPSFAYFASEKEIAVFSFDTNPATDGSAYLAARRGCISQRTWVRVLDYIFLLDAAGIYMLSSSQTQEVAQSILDIWSVESDGEYKIAWESKRHFHAVHDHEDATVRFFVSLSGPGYPRHSLCYNYVTQQCWIESYPFAVASSAEWQYIRHHVLVGGLGPRLLELGIGNQDGPNLSGCRGSGTASASTLTSLSDTYLSLPSSGMAGSPIVIIAGRGKGQVRLIDSVSGTRINVTQPWSILPDTTSQYQVGGIQWRRKSGWFRYPKKPLERDVSISFKPMGQVVGQIPNQTWQAGTGYLDIRVYYDNSPVPNLNIEDFPIGQASEDGLSWAKNDPNIVVDLSRSFGYIQFTMPTVDTPMNRQGNYVALEFQGTSSQWPTLIYEARCGAAER